MAITPDGSTLIVAESYGRPAHRVRHRAPTAACRAGASGPSSAAAYPDGICLDADGRGLVRRRARTGAACASARAARCSQTVELDRGCFACMLGGDDGRTLFVTANEWGGPEQMADGRTGQVVAVEAPAPHAGRP